MKRKIVKKTKTAAKANNIKITTKLIRGFIIVAVLAGITGTLGITGLMTLKDANQAMYEQNVTAVIIAGQLAETFQEASVNVRDMVTANRLVDIRSMTETLNANLARIASLAAELDPLITDPDIREPFDAFVAGQAEYNRVIQSVISLAEGNSDGVANDLIQGSLSRAARSQSGALNDVVGQINAATSQSAAETSEIAVASILFMAGIIAIAFITSILIGMKIARGISHPILQAQTMVDEMSRGKLQRRLAISGTSEIARMSQGLDKLADYLQKTVIATVSNIARGNLEMDLQIADDQDEITPALITTTDTLAKMLKNTLRLVRDVADGEMRSRMETQGYQGDWLLLADGINKVLDEVSGPISEASMVISKMAEGNLSLRMTGEYKGDHNEFIKNPLNKSLDTIASYVHTISDILTKMSNSDLDVGLTSFEFAGDFKPIQNSLNLLIYSFNKVLLDMNTAAEQVAAGSRQVSDGSQALSMGTTTQAGSIQELTASLTELASQTRKNADNAGEANKLSILTKDNAVAGNARMKDMQKAMEEINTSSKNISRIIKVIDDIAFQTNILALNAAVEAARAGQHGKGFAVVAEEVRNLAARSASAAQETTALIEGSIRKVALGTNIADETATALDRIMGDIGKTSVLVADIAKASNEQATGIAQINTGIEQVSQVVQANSATAEQSAAASEELAGQSDNLKQMINGFKINETVRNMLKKATAPEINAPAQNPQNPPAAATSAKKADAGKRSRDDMIADYQRQMTDKKAKAESSAGHTPPRAAQSQPQTAAKPRIALSDNEFDKF